MTKVRFNDLTSEQLYVLKEVGELNGCGGKGSYIPIPDWIFTASCDHHDFNYWIGGTEDDRAEADWQFYQAMLEDANSQTSWWKRGWYRWWAYVYYKAVRSFSSSYFYYGEERTLEDVKAIIDDYTELSTS